MHWDSYLGEYICPSFAFNTPAANTFTAVNMITTATALTLPRYKTTSFTTFSVYDVNRLAQDVSAANPKTDMTNTLTKDLGTTCTTNGLRIFVPIDVVP